MSKPPPLDHRSALLACQASLAEIESNVIRLAEAISKTQKRTNALNNIMIPRLSSQIKTISDALDEKDREDFSRLKVIKSSREGS